MAHGADPEFVIVDADGKPVPAHKAGIRGKDEKHDAGYGKFFRDGYNLEINPMPATCRAVFGNGVRSTLNAALKVLTPQGYSLSPRTFFEVDLSELEDAPPDVVEFGCNPSYDAWNKGRPKMVELNGRTFSRRMTGGHLHLTDDANERNPNKFTAALRDPDKYPLLVQKYDEYLGVMLAAVYNEPEQWERRKFYGSAGDYRPQRHPAPKYYSSDRDLFYLGVEYRTPPSALFQHHAMVCLAFGVMRWVTQQVSLNTEYAEPVSAAKGEAIRNAINKGEGALELVPSIPGYYDKDTIAALAKVPDIRRFDYVLSTEECHNGWNEYANRWGLKRPLLPDNFWRDPENLTQYGAGFTYSHGYETDWRWMTSGN